MKKEIYIYGHKNPDTDSICSAIGLAHLKNEIAKAKGRNESYIPMAAGEVNSETAYVLERFGVEAPRAKGDIRKQVKDIEIKKAPALDEDTTILKAWDLMQAEKNYTIPVKDKSDEVIGIITIGDMARAYMDVYNNTDVNTSDTTYKNVCEVLQGRMLVGDIETVITDGKVGIAAANIEKINNLVFGGDIAILCDDEKTMNYLIEKRIRCMIIVGDVVPSQEVLDYAKENGVDIISTPFDAYKVARMINKSLPIKNMMRRKENVSGFKMNDFVDDVTTEVIQKRYREYPVEDENGNFVGMISKSSLLEASEKQVILVDHNEMNQAVFGLFDAEVVEIVDHHKLGTVETLQPISVTNMPVGSTATIVYNMFKTNCVEVPKDIAGLLVSAILSDTMLFKSPTCTVEDMKAAKEISELTGVNLDELWEGMLRASLDLDSKTEKEIFYQDYKQFPTEGFTFGAGQVLAANEDDVKLVKKRMLPYLDIALKEEGIDMVCLMITNVSAGSTELIFAGENAEDVLRSAFETKAVEQGVYLEGVVSRKKQLIPPIMAVLQ